MTLSAQELLAGGEVTYEVEIPEGLLGSATAPASKQGSGAGKVRVRPLTVRDLQLVTRAAKDSDSLLATLMLQRALIEPELDIQQAARLPAGLALHLLHRIKELSGIDASQEQLASAATDPFAKAAFVLEQAFGWTPGQISELTMGQVLLHLKMLEEHSR